MYQQDDEIIRLLDSLSAMKHEVVVFQLMGKNELDFDFKDYGSLEDLETGETVQINHREALETYKDALNAHLNGIRMQLLGKHIFHRMIINCHNRSTRLCATF